MDSAKDMARVLITAKKGRRLNRNDKYLYGGSDSYAYNEMTRVASMASPRNPLSGSKMSTAFRPEVVGDDFWTMRTNWVIQSTGSAMLHAFLTGVEFLIRKYRIQAKFCISIHDSILYMAKEQDAEKLVAIFQVAHAWTWAWLRYQYGIYELPQNNAWFSSVEIDHVFRKSATESVVTVSNEVDEPHGKAYMIKDIIGVCNQLF
jgi:DNA polymerase gamma 1